MSDIRANLVRAYVAAGIQSQKYRSEQKRLSRNLTDDEIRKATLEISERMNKWARAGFRMDE